MDKRHQRRSDLVQKLFSYTFEGVDRQKIIDSDEILKHVIEHMSDIDGQIRTHAPRYPLDDIARIDLSILRLAIYELLYDPSNPPKVVIDEAVQLAREYGQDKSYSFVNGVLGSVLKSIEPGS